MKRTIVIITLITGLALAGCGSATPKANEQAVGTQAGKAYIACISKLNSGDAIYTYTPVQASLDGWVAGKSSAKSFVCASSAPQKALTPKARAAAVAYVTRWSAQVDADTKVQVRKDALTQLQDSILTDARKAVMDGWIEGPISKVDCTPATSADATNPHQATFSCLAVNQTASDGTEHGSGWTGTINYDTGNLSWHLGGGGLTP